MMAMRPGRPIPIFFMALPCIALPLAVVSHLDRIFDILWNSIVFPNSTIVACASTSLIIHLMALRYYGGALASITIYLHFLCIKRALFLISTLINWIGESKRRKYMVVRTDQLQKNLKRFDIMLDETSTSILLQVDANTPFLTAAWLTACDLMLLCSVWNLSLKAKFPMLTNIMMMIGYTITQNDFVEFFLMVQNRGLSIGRYIMLCMLGLFTILTLDALGMTLIQTMESSDPVLFLSNTTKTTIMTIYQTIQAVPTTTSNLKTFLSKDWIAVVYETINSYSAASQQALQSILHCPTLVSWSETVQTIWNATATFGSDIVELFKDANRWNIQLNTTSVNVCNSCRL